MDNTTIAQTALVDRDLCRRFDISGPRYTSYPTADRFQADPGAQLLVDALRQRSALDQPLSLYVHLPFCSKVCYYCGCNKVITKDHNKSSRYLDYLEREIDMQVAELAGPRTVTQLHWGGGTPTFLSYEQMKRLMDATRAHFNLHDDDSGEYSIEVDPRETNDRTIAQLRELGFNRISLGLQDFDQEVQKAVNRLQSKEQTFAVLEAARKEGFRSTNVDLIYGLPKQTEATFAGTLEQVLVYAPDRFSIFNYAHMPSRFKTQRQINEADLPSPADKLEILQMIGRKLTEAGYVYIGMDHFAKPDDELAVAQREGKLYRNFQGYSTHSDCDLVGLGITSIGRVGDAYIQNYKELDEYDAAISQGKLPVYRGVELDGDDKLRRAVITQLICHFDLCFSAIEREFGIVFADYFKPELEQLKTMEADGLLSLCAERIHVLSAGRMLIRNICMVFDKYLARKQQQFSRVI